MASSMLLVGGNGFIGRALASELSPHFPVRIFDRPGTTPLTGVDFFPGDIESTQDLEGALRGCETMVYLVHQTGTSPYLDPDSLSLVRNLDLFLTALEAARNHGIRKVVLFSSGGAVYGPPGVLPVPESHPLRPISAYGICKAAMESYLEMFAARHGMHALVVRPSNPYGPGQDPRRRQGVIAVFLDKIRNGEPIEIWGDGSATKDYLHVWDLAHAVRLLLEKEVGGVFNIGSGHGTSLLEIVRTTEQALGRSAAISFKPPHPTDVTHFVLDVSKLRAATGFAPRAGIDLRQMVPESVDK